MIALTLETRFKKFLDSQIGQYLCSMHGNFLLPEKIYFKFFPKMNVRKDLCGIIRCDRACRKFFLCIRKELLKKSVE